MSVWALEFKNNLGLPRNLMAAQIAQQLLLETMTMAPHLVHLKESDKNILEKTVFLPITPEKAAQDKSVYFSLADSYMQQKPVLFYSTVAEQSHFNKPVSEAFDAMVYAAKMFEFQENKNLKPDPATSKRGLFMNSLRFAFKYGEDPKGHTHAIEVINNRAKENTVQNPIPIFNENSFGGNLVKITKLNDIRPFSA